MPTGYTEILQRRPDVSFREFALRCARAMGACIMQREDPMDNLPDPEEKPSTYHEDEIARLEAFLRMLRGLTPEEAERQVRQDYERQESDRLAAIADKQVTLQTYERMLAEVNVWNPPSSDHAGLKEFMVEQVEKSIDCDCDTTYYQQPTVKEDATTWVATQINKATEEIDYHTRKHREEVKRTEQRNEWKRQLMASLGSDCE